MKGELKLFVVAGFNAFIIIFYFFLMPRLVGELSRNDS